MNKYVSPEREIRFLLKIPFLKIMSNFVGKITPIRRPSAIYHIKYHAHSIADNAAAALDLPSRRSAASRSRLRRCGGVRKRERAACFSFRFLSIIFYIFNAAYFLSPTLFVRLRRAAASDIALRCESASRKNSADAPLCGVSARKSCFVSKWLQNKPTVLNVSPTPCAA